MAAQPLTFIIQSASPDRVHYALMMAASNAALGGPVTLFFGIGAEGVLRASPHAEQELAAFSEKLDGAGIASLDDLLAALVELDCRIAVCDSALAFAAITAANLRADIPVEVTGLTDILAHANGGQIIYV